MKTHKPHEPYPLNEFGETTIQSIAKRIIHLKAVGHADMTGSMFIRIFADSISGHKVARPVGVENVVWNGCAWSVATINKKRPHACKKIRVIIARTDPRRGAGIENTNTDIQATGKAVLGIYNHRLSLTQHDHDNVRMSVLMRNFDTQEFTIYERPIIPYNVNDYRWEKNKKGNLEAFDGEVHKFTWQDTGSQLTVIEPLPDVVTRFKIIREPTRLAMEPVIVLSGFKPDWVKIV